ncbi:MAG: sulfur carrier protein ThiS [Candidatus Loosdrechtia sp.]|uniref:sulfur carrier protein ThiS n=1 Tax=Candidatus Loosdrechtia sp. TaxID=3101272 RepID=UPI003A5EFE53|nr:MAG: sulfur carrier protein ThiS [Candidatus Jettenia sp. AMX2]
MKITLNGETKECPTGITIDRLLELYNFDKHRTVVELNSNIIPRKEHSSQKIKDADVLEVVIFVGGG